MAELKGKSRHCLQSSRVRPNRQRPAFPPSALLHLRRVPREGRKALQYHSSVTPVSLQDLVVGEERQAPGEGGDVHDGHGARHPVRRLEEGELGHLAVGRAARLVPAAAAAHRLLALLFVLLLVILLGAESHHLQEGGRTDRRMDGGTLSDAEGGGGERERDHRHDRCCVSRP